jgi:NADPH2:quinone reductase
MFNATPDEQRRCAEDINRWLAEGKIDVMIGHRFRLAETAAAHRMQEDNTINKAGTLTGKIVLTP